MISTGSNKTPILSLLFGLLLLFFGSFFSERLVFTRTVMMEFTSFTVTSICSFLLLYQMNLSCYCTPAVFHISYEKQLRIIQSRYTSERNLSQTTLSH